MEMFQCLRKVHQVQCPFEVVERQRQVNEDRGQTRQIQRSMKTVLSELERANCRWDPLHVKRSLEKKSPPIDFDNLISVIERQPVPIENIR
mmetsp:Transcript_33378/g.52180  ORF Transcript_33378/g.52180 Transcript_33378/m.52180 type:complete len:91 (+) Transcript_33378:70-342(+)